MADLLIHEHKKNGAGSYDNVYRKTKARIVETEDGGTAEQKFATMANHIADKNNPHNVTAAQVGARPNTWTPTASDVGADPAGSAAQALQNAKNYADTAAYEKAKEQGYTGTEAEFYAALVSLQDAPFLPLSGGTMEGVLAMGGNAISGVAAMNGPSYSPIEINEINLTSGFTTDGGITFNLNGCLVQGVNTPQSVTDAANKGYVDDLVGNINTVLDTINGEVV